MRSNQIKLTLLPTVEEYDNIEGATHQTDHNLSKLMININFGLILTGALFVVTSALVSSNTTDRNFTLYALGCVISLVVPLLFAIYEKPQLSIVSSSIIIYFAIILSYYLFTLEELDLFYYFAIPTTILIVFADRKYSAPIILIVIVSAFYLTQLQKFNILVLFFYPGLFNVSFVLVIYFLSEFIRKNEAVHQNEIRNQKELELLLETKSNQGNFRSQLIHDLNNILSAISTNIDLSRLHLLEGSEKERILASLDQITTIIDSSKGLMKSLIEFEQTGLNELEQESFQEYFTTILPIISIIIPSNIIFSTNLTYTPKKLGMKNSEMDQILINLIKNAVEATKVGDEIVVETHKEIRNEVEYFNLIVRDTGVGISKNTVDKIFKMKFTTKKNGFGIGLNSVKEIVKRKNGIIELVSEVDKGTEFSIFIPIHYLEMD